MKRMYEMLHPACGKYPAQILGKPVANKEKQNKIATHRPESSPDGDDRQGRSFCNLYKSDRSWRDGKSRSKKDPGRKARERRVIPKRIDERVDNAQSNENYRRADAERNHDNII